MKIDWKNDTEVIINNYELDINEDIYDWRKEENTANQMISTIYKIYGIDISNGQILEYETKEDELFDGKISFLVVKCRKNTVEEIKEVKELSNLPTKNYLKKYLRKRFKDLNISKKVFASMNG